MLLVSAEKKSQSPQVYHLGDLNYRQLSKMLRLDQRESSLEKKQRLERKNYHPWVDWDHY